MHSETPDPPEDSGVHERLAEMRALARILAGDGDPLTVLRTVAESVRSMTDALAVHIERIKENDSAGVVVVSAEPEGGADRPNNELDGASRIVIALGRRGERIGSIVLFRSERAPPVDAPTLDRLTDLATLASLALHQISLSIDAKETRDECRRIVEDKYRLINGVGEELKERLGVAAEYVQLLDTEGELTEREQHYIERSRQSIDAVIRIMRDLVQLSRIDTGNIAVHSEPANIAVLLRGIVRDFQLSVGTIGLEFDISVPDHLPVITTDIDYVRQVMDTLLSNAVRYSPVGGKVRVNADIQPGRRRSDPFRYICISITDAGPGISDPDLIFEEMYRVERRGDKPGFRLAIARRVARLLGGEITLNTAKGHGSTFSLWLPDVPPESVPSYTDLKQRADAALIR